MLVLLVELIRSTAAVVVVTVAVAVLHGSPVPHRDIIGSLFDVKPGGGLDTVGEEQGESATSCCKS